jgi:flagellin
MAISIFTNLTSLNAQRILGINNDRLAQSIERVFSGLRINTAFSTIPVD